MPWSRTLVKLFSGELEYQLMGATHARPVFGPTLLDSDHSRFFHHRITGEACDKGRSTWGEELPCFDWCSACKCLLHDLYYQYFNLIPLFLPTSILSTCTQDVLYQAASLHSMRTLPWRFLNSIRPTANVLPSALKAPRTGYTKHRLETRVSLEPPYSHFLFPDALSYQMYISLL